MCIFILHFPQNVITNLALYVLFQNPALSHGIEQTTCKRRDPERPSGSHGIETGNLQM